jgi:hypothetical protein
MEKSERPIVLARQVLLFPRCHHSAMQAVTNHGKSKQEVKREGEVTSQFLYELADFLRSLSALATCD